MRQISYQIDRTSLVNKEFITGPKRHLFLAELTRQIPSGQDEPFLPSRVANQNTRFTRGMSHGYITQWYKPSNHASMRKWHQIISNLEFELFFVQVWSTSPLLQWLICMKTTAVSQHPFSFRSLMTSKLTPTKWTPVAWNPVKRSSSTAPFWTKFPLYQDLQCQIWRRLLDSQGWWRVLTRWRIRPYSN